MGGHSIKRDFVYSKDMAWLPEATFSLANGDVERSDRGDSTVCFKLSEDLKNP